MARTTHLHIAVGVIADARNRILIAQRRVGTPGAGKWEFPGGKREVGESIQTALARELDEELGIAVTAARPLIRLNHDYNDRSVLLDVWKVTDWQGEPAGMEGQRISWCEPRRLSDYDLLSANKPIVDAIRLPDEYLITPQPGEDIDAFLRKVQAAVSAGIRLLRLRAWNLNDADYEALAYDVSLLAGIGDAQLLLDRDAAMLARVGAAGLHWPASALGKNRQRPVSAGKWFAVSCHDRRELQQAQALGADFATLSPVNETTSHPDASPLGWDGFFAACDGLALPVYALGGMGLDAMVTAWQQGAQGIAGVRVFWLGAR